MSQTHEAFILRDKIKPSSNRVFGFLFFSVFIVIAVWPWIFGDRDVRIWAMAVALCIFTITFTKPSLLGPASSVWLHFGRILHGIISPIIMGLIYFLTVTPTGLIFRFLRKDILNLEWDPDAKTYWITRDPAGPDPDSMSNQF